MNLLVELKRRNVLRAGVLYAGAVWALAQGLAQLLPLFGAYDWIARWFVIAGVIGFPFWIAFAWFYELTPSGLKRESDIDPADSVAHRTSRTLDVWIIGVMGVAIVLLLTNTFVWRQGAGLEDPTNALNSAAPIAAKSIAVLPFVDMSPGKDQEYFSDGISEELLNLLAKIPQLQVTARTSSFSFKGKEIAIPEIARQLHVAHVLEGSVRKAGDTVRITAQLIDAASGNHVWSQTYDRKLDDIFKIQDEIAADVVTQLKVTLLGAVPKSLTTDPKAYALFLQAKQVALPRNEVAFKQSDALYKNVLAIDPRYVPAWDGLSRNYGNEVGSGFRDSVEGIAMAREAAMKALEIDPDYAAAHAKLGWFAASYDNDLVAAARHFERALALDPADMSVLGNSAQFLRTLGRNDEAMDILELFVRRDPVNLTALNNLAIIQNSAGDYEAAAATSRTLLTLSPGRTGARSQLCISLLFMGDAAGALAQAKQMEDGYRQLCEATAYHALGRKALSDAALAELTALPADERPTYDIGAVHAFRGNADQAFWWLEQAAKESDSTMATVMLDPFLKKFHADPRWMPFLRKVGKAPEQLAKIAFKVSLPRDAGARTRPATP